VDSLGQRTAKTMADLINQVILASELRQANKLLRLLSSIAIQSGTSHSPEELVPPGMEAVAEGVENDKTVSVLQSLGCDLGQGYFFGKPVPETEFIARAEKDSFPVQILLAMGQGLMMVTESNLAGQSLALLKLFHLDVVGSHHLIEFINQLNSCFLVSSFIKRLYFDF